MAEVTAIYDLTTTTPKKLKAGDILNCPYSGSAKSITLPKGSYKLEVWGAQGGYRSNTSYGGKGGYSVGTLNLLNKTLVYLYSGGAGNTGKTAGGFNGGGPRQTYNGGGGGSDIRIGQDSLYARVIVAGGGGSDGSSLNDGGAGGGRWGTDGSRGRWGTGGGTGGGAASPTGTGTAGTDTAGSFGQGGKGLSKNQGYGGAGGGGWYGGSGVEPDITNDDEMGGGGGSGYVYTASTASNYPSGCLLNSGYYLTRASTTDGTQRFDSPTGSNETGHSGDGYCRITVIDCESNNLNLFVNVSGTWKEVSAAYANVSGVWKEVTEIGKKEGGSWQA